MIISGEIHKIAARLKLRPGQIEKDYVLGWILKGISENKFLREIIIFKGGTAIRKIYVKDYRLSEDLDFTYTEESMNEFEIKRQFELMSEWVKEESRIELRMTNENVNNFGNYSFYLEYTGPLGGTKNSVKVDISVNEMLCNNPEEIEIKEEYTDLSEIFKIQSYTINEILSEKMRSLMQRTAPRDLYDLWYLFEQEGYDITEYIFDFNKKAEFKDLNPLDFVSTVEGKKEKFKRSWKNELENQINDVPDFEDIWRDLNKHFRKFNKAT
ncbi:MAG: nucleotidyl transferase AbiEii/AbiGii toxin family protein [Ignavibacteria bacterium]|nr:nucleotidyl transferase AbiEii/AbiGii toxin family protein [Ignavibacteria bacterium]